MKQSLISTVNKPNYPTMLSPNKASLLRPIAVQLLKHSTLRTTTIYAQRSTKTNLYQQLKRYQSTKPTLSQQAQKQQQSQNQNTKDNFDFGYEKVRSNEVNPHAYFYRYLGWPVVKIAVIAYATYFGLDVAWLYLDQDLYPFEYMKELK
ncbi:unnamed protein product [Ambrosiozyma monospora]|uniref:Unnamed protein product n=1 Tax=Ambrosiozyma monospora TaxID=43982 RepID=A0A9W6Z4B6_AMBMO|nr:unnamed protein product [Ambrosiozyma monospora]